MSKILNAIKENFDADFKNKSVGFYLNVVAAILGIATAIIYVIGYKDDAVLGTYYTAGVPWLIIVGIVVFCVMSLFKVSAKFAPAGQSTVFLAALCVLLRNSYMYFTVIAYESSTPKTMFFFVGTFVFIVVALALSFAGVFVKQKR